MWSQERQSPAPQGPEKGDEELFLRCLESQVQAAQLLSTSESQQH